MTHRKTAIVSDRSVQEVARHTIRWTSVGILFASFTGTIMAFNGGWPVTWRIWEYISPIAIVFGVAVQAFCTLMQWSNRQERRSIKYIAPLSVDIGATYIGYGILLIPLFQSAFESTSLPTLASQILAHAGVLIVASWAAFYPEQNLIEE